MKYLKLFLIIGLICLFYLYQCSGGGKKVLAGYSDDLEFDSSFIPESYIGKVMVTWDQDDESHRTMILNNDFSFIDSEKFKWTALKGAVIDGASIPKPWWEEFGTPYIGNYRYATVIHDVYCASKEQSAPKIHKMFGEALKKSGVSSSRIDAMLWGIEKLGYCGWDKDVYLNLLQKQLLGENYNPDIEALLNFEQKNSDLMQLYGLSALSLNNDEVKVMYHWIIENNPSKLEIQSREMDFIIDKLPSNTQKEFLLLQEQSFPQR